MQKSKSVIRLFTLLMRKTVNTQFNLPGGTLPGKIVDKWLVGFENRYGNASATRLADYCICQVYHIHRAAEQYLPKWKISHSFGDKAMLRFAASDSLRYHKENCWLHEHNLTREKLATYLQDAGKHPLQDFIHPQYDEQTKRRKLSTQVGFYFCCCSTTLWTPFSKACSECTFARKCVERLKQFQPELYRLRSEKFKNEPKNEWE